jgi:hypothetical protein
MAFTAGIVVSTAEAIPPCTKTCIEGTIWICCPSGWGPWYCGPAGPC